MLFYSNPTLLLLLRLFQAISYDKLATAFQRDLSTMWQRTNSASIGLHSGHNQSLSAPTTEEVTLPAGNITG